MSEPHQQDDASLDQTLVAYLDGELDEPQRRQFEERLADDDALRGRMQKLQRAWDLLDRLPQAELDDNVARTTVEMVALSAQREVQRSQHRRWWSRALSAAGMAVAAVVGYVLVAWAVDQPNRQLTRDLPVIQNIDLYWDAENIAFVRGLASTALFEQDEPAGAEVPVDFSARRQALEDLTPSEKLQLQQRRDRFENLDPGQQKQYRTLHLAISGDSDAAHLHRVLAGYSQWLRSLSQSQRAELKGVPVERRVEHIVQLHEKQRQQRFRELASEPLGDDDARAILGWFDRYVELHQDELIQQMPPPVRQQFERWSDPTHRKHALMRMMPHFRGGLDLPQPTDEEIDALLASLSEKARSVLQAQSDPSAQLNQVRKWVGAAFWSRFISGIEPAKLETFYEGLKPEQRDDLERLPRDEMQRRLRRMYLQSRMGQHRGGGHPGGGGPPRWSGGRRGQSPGSPRGPGGPGRDGPGPPSNAPGARSPGGPPPTGPALPPTHPDD